MAASHHNNSNNNMVVSNQIKVSNHNRLASSHSRRGFNLNPLGMETRLLCSPISQVIPFKHNLQAMLSHLSLVSPGVSSSSSTMLLNSRASKRALRQCRRFHNSSSSLSKHNNLNLLLQPLRSNHKLPGLRRWQIPLDLLLQNHRSLEDAELPRAEQRYRV